MAVSRSSAQQAAARSHGPATAAGKVRSSRNGTRHGLRGGPFAILPGEDRGAFSHLHAAATNDWGPRDAYERRWLMELVTAMWRQDRLRGLELAALDAACAERPPTDATLKRLTTFARDGARIDKDMAKALQPLQTLRNRPDAWIEEAEDGTTEPDGRQAPPSNDTNELSPGGSGPEFEPANENITNEIVARTREPGPPPAAASPRPAQNRHQRRRQMALARQTGRGAA